MHAHGMHVHAYIIAIYKSKYLYCSLELYSYFIPDSEGYHPPPLLTLIHCTIMFPFILHHFIFLFWLLMESKKLTKKYTCVLSIIIKSGACRPLADARLVFLKLIWCGRRYACLCVSAPQAIKNYSREMKSE